MVLLNVGLVDGHVDDLRLGPLLLNLIFSSRIQLENWSHRLLNQVLLLLVYLYMQPIDNLDLLRWRLRLDLVGLLFRCWLCPLVIIVVLIVHLGAIILLILLQL